MTESALEKVKLARGRYRVIMMSCGYVESNTTSWLIFSTHSEVYNTAAEAVMELALDMYAKYEEDVLRAAPKLSKKCCKANRKDAANKYCAECGHRLTAISFDPDGFTEYVRGLHGTDCDSYGSAEDTETRSFAFWPFRADDIFGVAKDEVVFIAENGELVLLHALYESREDLRAEDESLHGTDETNWRLTDWEDVRRKGTNSSH